MTANQDLFEAVQEKLGPQPEAQWPSDEQPLRPETIAPNASEIDSLRARWIDPFFDPEGQAAIPFTIRFSDHSPGVKITGDREILPIYLDADKIAAYAPWHCYFDRFGAYVREGELLQLSAYLAHGLGVPIDEIALHVLRQIVLHEQAHFMFEIAAAELEDVSEEWFYRPYVTSGAGPMPPLTDGVGEEIWAAWREVEYARRVARRLPRLAGYPALIEKELTRLPAGYSDYYLMAGHAGAVRAAVASLMSRPYRPIVSNRWGAPTGKEADNMPIYWIGTEATLLQLGGIPRTVGFPTIRRFEQWLTLIGAEIEARGGRGSHRKVRLPNGRKAVYATSGGRLHQAPANQIARELGIGNAHTLFEYVRDMRVLA